MRERRVFSNLDTLFLRNNFDSELTVKNHEAFEMKDVIKTIRQFLPILTNKNLTNDFIVKMIDNQGRGALPGTESFFATILDILNPNKELNRYLNLIANLGSGWDQQLSWGSDALQAMKNYIGSPQGDIAQAKRTGSKGEWHYAEVRAIRGNWTWEDFYAYINGAKINYLFKTLPGGKYLGELISDHLYLGGANGWGFDADGLERKIKELLQKITLDSRAMDLILEVGAAIFKMQILKMKHPTIEISFLTWDQPQNAESIALKKVIERFVHLLETEEGLRNFEEILTYFLTSSFADDFIIDCGMLGYFTIPELFEAVETWPISAIIGDGLTARNVAKMFAPALINVIKQMGFLSILKERLSFGDQYAADLDLDFAISAKQFLAILTWKDSREGFEKLGNFFNDANSTVDLKTIFSLLGTNPGERNFKQNSPLMHIQIANSEPYSWLNQFLDIYEKVL